MTPEHQRELEERMKAVDMCNQVFNSFFPKLVPPNPSEKKVEKPLMFSEVLKQINGGR